MARVTDTRERVRDIAVQLSSQGVEPSPSLVRSLLGKGSPNTIVDELRAWKAERERSPLAAPSQAPAYAAPLVLERAGLDEVARTLRAASEHALVQASHLRDLNELRDLLSRSFSQQENLTHQLSQAVASVLAEREHYSRELVKMSERFDGMQKYMLRAIDDAREDTRVWKERARLAQEELVAWRTTVQQRIEMLREENGRLQGKLDQTDVR